MKAVKVSLPDGSVLADKAWRTQDVGERVKGFLGREQIDAGEGLIIQPCTAIHMLGMKVSLDVVFMDNSGQVLKVSRGLKPGRLAFAPFLRWLMPWRNQILELPEGGALGVEKGMKLKLEDR